jgi:hypothetical protein
METVDFQGDIAPRMDKNFCAPRQIGVPERESYSEPFGTEAATWC